MAHDEQPTPKQNVKIIQFREYGGETPPTLSEGLSGSLFLSGGALTFVGDTTQTQIAPA